ncbi:hypothetical protein CERZMDRAFT_102249 [Cercospora zeae-maydis SCOH1-5]|uniref:Zn(2)-C6 fungal-type domain-containing protein n=1 Tax=Cercospora zeae-maydis SCOH1-5 TaxID=717836 RepID=A0A6A6F5H4_9PEZI|nr:hypothetical protein CERZMDRAFT_102249 [Cercospora zeae-maydis SCOH1-5]
MSTAAYSPEMEPQGDDEGQQPLQRRATIGDPVYDNQAINRQRRKTAIVACERCRRRKIRCDGNQPCATCARFSVRCTKPEERRERSSISAEHAALADRVRTLEARLAAVTASEQGEPSWNPRPVPPALHLDTSFSADLPHATSAMDDMSMSDDFLSPNVPTIQITGPHGSNPSSPLALSPSPSLFSGTSRASSPDPFSAVSAFDYGNALGAGTLSVGGHGLQRTPPMSQWADVYSQTLQTPISPGGHHISRRSSVSSFGGLGEALCTPADQTSSDWSMEDPFTESDLNDAFGSFAQLIPEPTPSKSQAEALAEQVFNNLVLPIERSAFRVCLQAIYSLPSHATNAHPAVERMLSSYTTYTLRVARCLVFLVLSIGLRMNANACMGDAGLNACYQLAMQQMSRPDFWNESGSREVATLLRVFAEVSRS